MLSVPAHLPEGQGSWPATLRPVPRSAPCPVAMHRQFAAHPAPGNRNSVPDTDRF